VGTFVVPTFIEENDMKKRGLILAAIVAIVMSGLSNIALSISEDSQWTPYVLRWDQKLHVAKKKKVIRKKSSITICSRQANQNSITQQR
jgi:hypothetical protein